MAILTGAQLISEDLGLKLDKADASVLGSVRFPPPKVTTLFRLLL